MLTRLAEKMIFYPERGHSTNPGLFGLDYEDVFMTTSDGVRIHGWFFDAGSVETLLFFHGNAGTIADRLDNIYRLHQCDLSVFIIDYRGYGLSAGQPSEKGSYLDATAAWSWLQQNVSRDSSRIVIFGRSLGGAVAIELATRTAPGRLIIESSFTSVRELGHQMMPFLPRSVIPHLFPSIHRIGEVHCPCLFIHGTADSLIPFRHGRQLYACAPEPKFFYSIQNADHNDTYITGGTRYFDLMGRFIREGRLDDEKPGFRK